MNKALLPLIVLLLLTVSQDSCYAQSFKVIADLVKAVEKVAKGAGKSGVPNSIRKSSSTGAAPTNSNWHVVPIGGSELRNSDRERGEEERTISEGQMASWRWGGYSKSEMFRITGIVAVFALCLSTWLIMRVLSSSGDVPNSNSKATEN